MLLIKYLNFQFLYFKIMHKKLSYITRMVNNIRLFDMRVKNIKNMQSND